MVVGIVMNDARLEFGEAREHGRFEHAKKGGDHFTLFLVLNVLEMLANH